ncbi:MAG: glycoside hydrolase family 88 protein [Clostridia bacterium]|nr:glycoside hydrolase family 88 protein [Clostridia bacterium]MBR5985311.1 glycoside hydrolase family 88 protein [Clostridia bacterium]
MDKTALDAAIAKIISGITDKNNPMAFTARDGSHFMDAWDWFQGVALFGLYEYYRDSGDRKILEYLTNWFDERMDRQPTKNINSMCPLLTLSYLYEITERQDYLAVCSEWAEYAMASLPRTEEGGFQHITIDSDNYMQLWDDTLYMTVLFIARMGQLLKRSDMTEESVRQFLVHIKYLTDTKTGLLFHGFNFDGRHHYAEALWGRGNAWFTAGLVDYLDMARIPEGVKLFLLSTLETQAKALKKYQDADGMWHTLINDPESYKEASATAGFSYGLMKAVRKGYLDESCRAAALRGLDAIMSRIDENGLLKDVSAGTCLSDSLDYYRNIRVNAQPYGQSMALLLLMEAKKL